MGGTPNGNCYNCPLMFRFFSGSQRFMRRNGFIFRKLLMVLVLHCYEFSKNAECDLKIKSDFEDFFFCKFESSLHASSTVRRQVLFLGIYSLCACSVCMSLSGVTKSPPF